MMPSVAQVSDLRFLLEFAFFPNKPIHPFFATHLSKPNPTPPHIFYNESAQRAVTEEFMNSLKTVLLLGLLSGILIVGGGMLGGRGGMTIGLLLAIGMNFFSYFFSEKIALATYSAQPVTPEENPDVYDRIYPLVANLTRKMGLPMPKLWLI